jgi:hypothetical protein
MNDERKRATAINEAPGLMSSIGGAVDSQLRDFSTGQKNDLKFN